ncbi:MAG: hypothetical protein U0936_02780 [Planctomycetaceae bacterium]
MAFNRDARRAARRSDRCYPEFPDRKQDDGHWYVFDFTVTELRQLRLTERRSPGLWKDSGTRFPLEQGSFRISA